MSWSRNQALGRFAGTVGAGALLTMVAGGGCVAIADIGDIEFGPATGGAGGTGGTSTSSGTGGDAGSGGGSSCDDNEQNGQETGIDCGGPDCPECSEDCTNGEDDDGNNLVDCEDPLCAGYHCAPGVPNGWSGPVALYHGPSGNPVPSCDPAWTNPVVGGAGTLTAPPAACSACGCDPPTGDTCAMPTFLVWTDPDCPGTANLSLTISAADACDSFGGNSNDSVMAGTITGTGGSCATSGGTPTIDSPSWSEAALACNGATLGAGCTGPTDVCVRSPQSPFASTVCVSQAGDVDCPNQDYSEKHLMVLSVSDTRTCTACTCGAPAGGTCTGTTTVNSNQACSQTPLVVPNDGATCVNAPAARSVILTNLTGPTGASCDAGGGQADGDVTVDSAVTVCCLPE